MLNNSRVHGLAHQAAAQFAEDGWQIRLVGNFTGRIPVTTVYYGPGEYAAAVQLAREFDQVQQVLPRFAGLPGNGLTIVLTEDYQVGGGGK